VELSRARAARVAPIRGCFVHRLVDAATRPLIFIRALSCAGEPVGVGCRRGSPGDFVSARRAPASPAQLVLVGITSLLLLLHAAGWFTAAIVVWQNAALHIPRAPSSISLGLAFLVLRAASARRRNRRLVVIGAITVAAVAFVAVPLPREFQGHDLMPDGGDTASSRDEFTTRFRVREQVVNFHSHLGDVVMAMLDDAFGGSDTSPPRTFDTISRLAGLLFLLELGVAAAWHKWSRQSCRYVGLAMATPLCLLYFGYWELGYLSMAAGVVPLLALGRSRSTVQADASTLAAGSLQGLHTALHGFGMLGIAGGALACLSGRGDALRRLLRTATFTSSAVAFYLGWIFLYMTFAGMSIVWARQLGHRPIWEPMVFEGRIANPLLSQAGLGEFGLFSALSGVPILALAVLTSRRITLVPAILYALPGLIFLVRWWSETSPYNLDLLLSVFPGVFAASWMVASSRRNSMSALVIFAGLHALLWTMLGNGLFSRVSVGGAQ
jgi:hypothetical protein